MTKPLEPTIGFALPIHINPTLIIVTRVLGDGDGDGNDLVLGPGIWRVIENYVDSTTILVVSPGLEARAREVFPGVRVDKGTQ